MRPKAEYAIDSEAMRAWGIIVFCSEIQLVGQNNIETKRLSLVKTRQNIYTQQYMAIRSFFAWQAPQTGKMHHIPRCNWLWIALFVPAIICRRSQAGNESFLSQNILRDDSKKISGDLSVGMELENRNAPSLLYISLASFSVLENKRVRR